MKKVSFTLNKTKHCVQFKPINPDHLFKGTVHPENKNIFTFACSALCPLLFSYCCLKIFCFSAKFSFLCYIDTVVVFVRCIRSDKQSYGHAVRSVNYSFCSFAFVLHHNGVDKSAIWYIIKKE